MVKVRSAVKEGGVRAPDLAARLVDATSKTELDQADLARVLATSPRTVSRWLQGTSPRPDTRERLLEVIAVLEQLSAVLRGEPAHDWLFTPNPLLDHYKPVDLLRRGDFRRVLGAVEVMAEGVFV